MNQEPITIFGLQPVDVATLLAAFAAMAMMLAVWAATTVRDPMRARVKALTDEFALYPGLQQ